MYQNFLFATNTFPKASALQIFFVAALVILFVSPLSARDVTSVAVVGFYTTLPDEKAGEKLRELVCSELGRDPSHLQLLERARIDAILKEHAFQLSGTVDNATCGKTATLLGANLLLLGRAYPLGDETWIAAKMFNVATGQSETVLVKMPARTTLAELASALSAGVIKKIDAIRGAPSDTVVPDPRLTCMNEKLGSRKRPLLYIEIDRTAPIDATLARALRLEATLILMRCGFRVEVPVSEKTIALKLTLSARPNRLSRVESHMTCESTVTLSCESREGSTKLVATGIGHGMGPTDADASALELLPKLVEQKVP
jgi:hypothetical protein